MKMIECVKIMESTSPVQLEEAYRGWFTQLTEQRSKTPQTKNQPLIIRDRKYLATKSGKSTTYSLAVFYEHLLLEEKEQGVDRGKHLDKSGVSSVGPRRRR